MPKILKFILFLVICFFGFETYRIFTHSHPAFQKEQAAPKTAKDLQKPTTTPETPIVDEKSSEAQNPKSDPDSALDNSENLRITPQPSTQTQVLEQPQSNGSTNQNLSEPAILVKNPISRPKLTIIFYSEGIGKDTLQRVNPHLKGGLHEIMHQGLCYKNAFFGIPNNSSAQEIASLTTGSFAAIHGLVNNIWLDAQGDLFGVVQDNDLSLSAVFNPLNGTLINIDETPPLFTKFYKSGISPKNYKVSGISDLIIQNPKSQTHAQVISIGSTPETAVLMANFQGKAFWMDPVTGLFTTSKYFYSDNIPQWVQNFNAQHLPPEKFIWQPANSSSNSPHLSTESERSSINNFNKDFKNQSLIGATIASQDQDFGSLIYNMGPKGLEVFFEFVNQTIQNWIETSPNDDLVLWINHSGFNAIAAAFGSKSQEAYDLIYHIDNNMKKVIDLATSKIGPEKCLFLFAGNEKNYELTCTTDSKEQSFASSINQYLGNDYVQEIITPYIYMNQETFGSLKCADQTKILQNIKYFLKSFSFIQNAWTFDELQTASFDFLDMARFTKLSNFQNPSYIDTAQEHRCGEIVFQMTPTACHNLQLSKEIKERSFFDPISVTVCNNNAALYIYMPHTIEKKTIYEPVLMNQVPLTIAEIFNIPRPLSAPIDLPILPHIFE